MKRPTRRLDLPAFPCSRSRPRHCRWGQLEVSRLRRMGQLQLLVLLLQLGSLALLLRLAGQIEPPPRPPWSGGVDAQSGSALSLRIAR
jgi:hypothetical protein